MRNVFEKMKVYIIYFECVISILGMIILESIIEIRIGFVTEVEHAETQEEHSLKELETFSNIVSDNKEARNRLEGILANDKIRVLLSNPKGGYYFDRIDLQYEQDNQIKNICVEKENMKVGEILQINSDSDFIIFQKKGDGDKNYKYRGILDITCDANGLYIVDELKLDEYLYGVVPSEMPASYPEEALKAQAICARTYAYHFLLEPGLPQFGANLDDTVSYQVYGNIEEQQNCNEIVDATTNQFLGKGHVPKIVYYYSTNGTNEKEGTEPFYKWEYTVEDIDKQELWKRLLNAFNKKKVETKLEHGDTYLNNCIVFPNEIHNISIVKYSTNGYADELLIDGDGYSMKIQSEYMIRSVLCDGHSKVTTQDLEERNMQTLLPSAYISIEPRMMEENVVGYNIVGGGFGHGIGMSQNGAKWMAKDGNTYQDILTHYYPDYELFDTIKSE